MWRLRFLLAAVALAALSTVAVADGEAEQVEVTPPIEEASPEGDAASADSPDAQLREAVAALEAALLRLREALKSVPAETAYAALRSLSVDGAATVLLNPTDSDVDGVVRPPRLSAAPRLMLPRDLRVEGGPQRRAWLAMELDRDIAVVPENAELIRELDAEIVRLTEEDAAEGINIERTIRAIRPALAARSDDGGPSLRWLDSLADRIADMVTERVLKALEEHAAED